MKTTMKTNISQPGATPVANLPVNRLQLLSPGTTAALPDGTTAVCRAMAGPWSKSPCSKCQLRHLGDREGVPLCFALCNARNRPDRRSVYFEKVTRQIGEK